MTVIAEFHLKGTAHDHDQSSHAGGGDELGDLDELDGEHVEASTATIVEKLELYDGDREYATTDGGRLYRAPDDRYVILLDEDDGVYVDVVDDLYEAEGRLDLEPLETEIADAWREEVVHGPVYHGTSSDESVAAILEGGLERRNQTRGLNNRWVGSSVFTTSDPSLAEQYGTVIEIDLPAAIADGVIDPLDLSREPGYDVADAMMSVAHSFEDHDYDPYSQYIGSGEDPNTVIIGAEIPARYLRRYDNDEFSIRVFRQVFRFDPNQPRVPAGAAGGGRWTPVGGAGTVDSPTAARAALLAGRKTTMLGVDAAEVIEDIGANVEGPVDLTNLDVDGYPNIFLDAKNAPRSRADMPQIPQNQIENFRETLEAAGIDIHAETVNPVDIWASQNELNAVNVGQMMTKIRAGTFTAGHPPWVSRDGFILDGHHRWAAFALLSAAGHAAAFDVLRVDLPIAQLLMIADDFNDAHNIQARRHGMAAATEWFAAALYAELAGCRDESCAPPPHGTGGSLPSNSQGRTIAQVGKDSQDERARTDLPASWFANGDEVAAARALADEKARNVPKPTAKQLAKNLAALEKAKTSGRAGGELRGNSYTRRARAEALFAEFGGKERGYCPCGHCGIKVSPRGEGGYAHLQQDKILTASEGGTYGTARSFPNLIPSCGGCNSSRNDAPYPVRPEWMDQPLAAAAGRTFFESFGIDDLFVAELAEAKPVGWEDPTLDADTVVSGPYYARQARTWFGTYDQHLVGGEVVDMATIKIITPRPGRGVEMVWDDNQRFHLKGTAHDHDQSSHASGGGIDVAALADELGVPECSADGDCIDVSARVAAAIGDGAEVVSVVGWVDEDAKIIGFMHNAVQVGDDIVDLTATQFDSDLPRDWMTSTEEYQRVLAERTGVSRVTVRRASDGLFAVEQFHLRGTEHDHNQQAHAGGGARYRGSAAAETERVAALARRGVDPADFDGPVMHRGIAIQVSPELKQRIDNELYSTADHADFNRQLHLGPIIAEQLLGFEGHQGIERLGGLGQSWTTRESVAESVSAGSGTNLVVKVTARPRQGDVVVQEVDTPDGRTQFVDAQGKTTTKGRESDLVSGEMEVRIPGKSPVEILDVQVNVGNSQWVSVWGEDGGFGAGAEELYRMYPSLRDEELTVERLELASGMPGGLRNYWLNGEGAAKIAWGTPGDFTRCVANLREHVSDPKGTCANLHRDATGMWPGDKRNPGMAADTEGLAFDPNQPRFPAGHPQGGQWAPTSGAVSGLADPDSGFTRYASSLQPVESGYAVALGGTDRLVVAADAFHRNGRPTTRLKQLVKDRLNAAAKTPVPDGTVRALGAWHNPADGKIEINVTAVFPADQYDAAFAYAQSQDQIAMANLDAITAGDWDNAIIDTGGTGGDRDDETLAASAVQVFRLD